MNNTYFALMSEFGTGTVALSDICEKYFGLNPAQAQRKARRHELPVPTFRGANSQKCPVLISLTDLAKHLDEMRAIAQHEFTQVNH